MKTLAVLVPDDKDLESFLENSRDNYDVEYLKYLIHYVINGLSKYIESPYPDSNGNYRPLHKQYIGLNIKEDLIIGDKKHKKHVDYLRSDRIDIVKRNSFTTYSDKVIGVFYRKNYEVGVSSFGYRFNPRFYRKGLKIHKLKHYSLINKINKKHSKTIPIINSGAYKFLKKFFDSNTLKIDLTKAVELCEQRWSKHKKYGKYLNEMVQIIDIYNGIYQIYYKEDTDARIHTNITRLPKAYRKYVKYNNSTLVEVDLSNSVMYFLSMLFSCKIDYSLSSDIPLLLMFVNSLTGIDTKEVEEMTSSSVDGKFYNDFMDDYQSKYPQEKLSAMYEEKNDDDFLGSEEQIRKVVKKQILAMIFAKAKSETYKIERDVFKTKYPNLLNIINSFKNEFGYKKLSHLLLQLEAHFMIDKAGRSFNKQYGRKAPLFTLHDCLITTEEYGDRLKDVMESVFTELIGKSPKMKIEKW